MDSKFFFFGDEHPVLSSVLFFFENKLLRVINMYKSLQISWWRDVFPLPRKSLRANLVTWGLEGEHSTYYPARSTVFSHQLRCAVCHLCSLSLSFQLILLDFLSSSGEIPLWFLFLRLVILLSHQGHMYLLPGASSGGLKQHYHSKGKRFHVP